MQNRDTVDGNKQDLNRTFPVKVKHAITEESEQDRSSTVMPVTTVSSLQNSSRQLSIQKEEIASPTKFVPRQSKSPRWASDLGRLTTAQLASLLRREPQMLKELKTDAQKQSALQAVMTLITQG